MSETDDLDRLPIGLSDELGSSFSSLGERSPADADLDLDLDQVLAHAAQTTWSALEQRIEAGELSLGDIPASRVVHRIVVDGEPAALTMGSQLVIGRLGDLRIDELKVSRRHLHVSVTLRGLQCRDLGSGNGSWIVRDGVRIEIGDADMPLAPGDRVVTIEDIELLRVDHR